MKFDLRDCVQRGHYFAIVDEVDSILIDEARTPLIISGPSEESTDKYARVNRIIPKLEKGEEIEMRRVKLKNSPVTSWSTRSTAASRSPTKAGKKLNGCSASAILPIPRMDLKHHVEVAIKAHTLYRRDIICGPRRRSHHRRRLHRPLDEGTSLVRWFAPGGRSQRRRRDREENQTLATITLQNYFRLYKKLSGMTGTAETEAAEFDKIYKPRRHRYSDAHAVGAH